MRLVSISKSSFDSDPSLSIAPYICWTQAELAYAIMAATIPTARKFMLNFITYYNGVGYSTAYGGSDLLRAGPGSASRREAFQMAFLKPSSNRKSEFTYTGSREQRESQEDMMIRIETTVEVNRDSISRSIPDK